MPAEWERHRATWLSWPHNRETWPGAVESMQRLWAGLARELAVGEEVHVLAGGEAQRRRAAELLDEEGCPRDRVFLHGVATDDAWMRDCGPTFVSRLGEGATEHLLIDWDYNAWGGKYPPWDGDDAVPARLGELLDLPVFRPGIVLEGGSIEVNGAGTLLTTESCLLHGKRNPHLDRGALEGVLAAALGVSHVVWLGDGIAGDDTDGHVDDLTRFCAARIIVTVIEDDAGDVNYRPLRENAKRLERARDQDGRAFDIATLPMPPALELDGQRLPASYANFYIANDIVVMPTFRSPRDDTAADILQGLFADRKVIGIDAVELIRGLGAFHCITQQQPT